MIAEEEVRASDGVAAPFTVGDVETFDAIASSVSRIVIVKPEVDLRTAAEEGGILRRLNAGLSSLRRRALKNVDVHMLSGVEHVRHCIGHDAPDVRVPMLAGSARGDWCRRSTWVLGHMDWGLSVGGDPRSADVARTVYGEVAPQIPIKVLVAGEGDEPTLFVVKGGETHHFIQLILFELWRRELVAAEIQRLADASPCLDGMRLPAYARV